MEQPFLPCPLGCGQHATPATIESHLRDRHPAHHAHLLPEIPLCPHVRLGAVIIHGPEATLLGGDSMGVN